MAGELDTLGDLGETIRIGGGKFVQIIATTVDQGFGQFMPLSVQDSQVGPSKKARNIQEGPPGNPLELAAIQPVYHRESLVGG